MDELTCPSCLDQLASLHDLCDHRDRFCFTCCLSGEHHWWTPPEYENGSAA